MKDLYSAISVVLFLLLLALPRLYGQTGVGGRFAAGGKPATVLAVFNPACSNPPLTNVNKFSVGATSSGSSRLFLAYVQHNGSPYVSGVTIGSQDFTLVDVANGEDQVHSSTWKLIAPIVGNQTVEATLSGIVGAGRICVFSLENVDQTLGVRNFVPANGAAGPVNMSIVSAPGNVVITSFVSLNNFITSANDIMLSDQQPGNIVEARIGAKLGAANVTVNYNLSGVNAWAASLLDIIKAP